VKPDDASGNLPVSERPFRVLIISGSNRRQYNCPGVDSKARTMILPVAERLPQEWQIDYEDLGNSSAGLESKVVTRAFRLRWPCVFGPAIVTRRAARKSPT
jgi:hypothetical protein